MNTWHADAALLARYADDEIDATTASSLEAHLVACDECRERLACHVPAPRLVGNWDAVLAALDAPRPGPLERALVAARVRPSTARLLVATPTLRWSWFVSVSLALAFTALAAARPAAGALAFALVAPLVPVAGVAVAFSRSLDPSAEIADATPLGGLPLLFVRTIASLGPSVVVAAATGLLVDSVGDVWAACLLPALALSASSLLLSSLLPIGRAAFALGAVWAVAVLGSEAVARGAFDALRAGGTPQSVLFEVPGQVLAAVVAAAAVAAMSVFARHTFEPGRPA